jgi:hypothetical protein
MARTGQRRARGADANEQLEMNNGMFNHFALLTAFNR